jgi:Protein of unknown function (DUF4238)
MGSTVKNQHYVPQSYLQRFADKSQIWVYDKSKPKDRIYRSAVRNVASETYFYDIPAEAIPPEIGLDRQFIEKRFAKMEADFKLLLDQFISRIDNYSLLDRTVDWLLDLRLVKFMLIHFKPDAIRQGRILESQRLGLAFYIVQQILRTREFRNWSSELQHKMTLSISNLLLKMRGEENVKVGVSYSETQNKLYHLQLLLNPDTAKGIFECIANHIWSIGVNISSEPLFTSDNPVVKRANIRHPVLSYSGWCSPGIEIFYPISERYVLILSERDHFSKLQDREGRLITLTRGNVIHLNSLQVFQSYRQIYCRAKNFGLAEQICEEHPDVCNPLRVRIQASGT